MAGVEIEDVNLAYAPEIAGAVWYETYPDTRDSCYARPMSRGKAVPTKTDGRRPGFVVGREAFETISAVEGIRPSAASQARAAEFDRRGRSAEERRRAIIEAHRPAK